MTRSMSKIGRPRVDPGFGVCEQANERPLCCSGPDLLSSLWQRYVYQGLRGVAAAASIGTRMSSSQPCLASCQQRRWSCISSEPLLWKKASARGSTRIICMNALPVSVGERRTASRTYGRNWTITGLRSDWTLTSLSGGRKRKSSRPSSGICAVQVACAVTPAPLTQQRRKARRSRQTPFPGSLLQKTTERRTTPSRVVALQIHLHQLP